MRAIWSDQRKFETWLEIETIACDAMARLGLIPKEDAAVIVAAVKLNVVSLVATLAGMCAVAAALLAEGFRQLYFAVMRREES